MEYLSFWTVAIVLNAAFGIFCLETAWKKFDRYRNPNKELCAIYPALFREDALKWKKWQFYFGAVTMMLPRLICFVGFPLIIAFWNKIFMFNHEVGKPMTGMTKTLVRCNYSFHGYLQSLTAFFTILTWRTMTPHDVNNYEEYLGSVEQ